MQLSKEYTRSFELNLEYVGRNAHAAQQVIDLIEVSEIKIFRPDFQDFTINENILAGASVSVSLKEWLPVICQCVYWFRLAKDDDPDTVAQYQCNLSPALIPPNGQEMPPVGPAAFYAFIGPSKENQEFICQDGKVFAHTLAHELTHAFRHMPFVIPAFLDWPTYKETTEFSSDIYLDAVETTQKFVDSYGEANELAEVQEFWPDDLAEEWFNAFQVATAELASE